MDVFGIIKTSVDITNVLTAYGIRFKNKKALCCFHNEKNPSLTVSSSKQIFKCHTCDVGGDSIFFVSKLFSLTPFEAAKKINNDFNLNLNIAAPTLREKINAKKIIEDREKKKREHVKLIDSALKQYKILKIIIEECVEMSDTWCYAIHRIDEVEYTYDKLINDRG